MKRRVVLEVGVVVGAVKKAVALVARDVMARRDSFMMCINVRLVETKILPL